MQHPCMKIALVIFGEQFAAKKTVYVKIGINISDFERRLQIRFFIFHPFVQTLAIGFHPAGIFLSFHLLGHQFRHLGFDFGIFFHFPCEILYRPLDIVEIVQASRR